MTEVQRACELLLSATLGEASQELTAAGQLLANKLRTMFVLRGDYLVPPKDSYGGGTTDDFTVLFFNRSDAEIASKYENEEWNLETQVIPLSDAL